MTLIEPSQPALTGKLQTSLKRHCQIITSSFLMSYLFCLGRRNIRIKDRDKKIKRWERKGEIKLKDIKRERYELMATRKKKAKQKKGPHKLKKTTKNGKLV